MAQRLGPSLRWAARAGFLILALVYLGRHFFWEDRIVVTVDGRPREGLSLVDEGPRHFLITPSERIEVSTDQAAHAVLRPGIHGTWLRMGLTGVLLGLFIYLASFLVSAERWRVLLGVLGHQVQFKRTCLETLKAQSISVVLPGSIGGDVYRMGALADLGVSTWDGAAVVAFERAVGLWVLVILLGVLGHVIKFRPLGPFPDFLLLGGLAAPVFVLAINSARARRVLNAPWFPKPAFVTKVIVRLLPWQGRLSSGAFLRVALISAVNSLMHAAATAAIVSAFHSLAQGFWSLMMAIALGNVVNALPLTPGGIGVGEAGYVWLLGLVGVQPAESLSAALAARLVMFAVGVGAAPLLLISSKPPHAPTPIPPGR